MTTFPLSLTNEGKTSRDDPVPKTDNSSCSIVRKNIFWAPIQGEQQRSQQDASRIRETGPAKKKIVQYQPAGPSQDSSTSLQRKSLRSHPLNTPLTVIMHCFVLLLQNFVDDVFYVVTMLLLEQKPTATFFNVSVPLGISFRCYPEG